FRVARIKCARGAFCFSGIKTAVLYPVRREGIPPVADPAHVPAEIRDLLASFQRAVVEALVRGLVRGAEEHHPASLVVTGGVAAYSPPPREAAGPGGRLGPSRLLPPPAPSAPNTP